MRIRSVFSHTAQALAEGALIALIVVGLVAGSAFAARGGGGKPSGGGTTSGACAETSGAVVVGGQYTISGWGFKADQLLNVWVTDSHGTQSLFPPVGTDGRFTAVSYASWAGTSQVSVYDNSGRKMVLEASCSFTVG